jgi:5-methylcytosine-specific restriction endonuclease McrBC regulatory subunit McrC
VIEATPNFNSHNKQKIIDANKLKQVRHSFYREYSELQRLCIFILQYEKQQIGLGENQVYGVLFDGAWLWEEYVNILIEKDFYHPKNKQGEGKQYFFGYSNDSTRSIGLIYPDFIGKNAKVIADAKYKPFDNIHSRDYFQILSYMFRFDAICGYFIYPENDHNQQDNVLYLKQGNSYENNVSIRDDIMVKKIGLKIPNNAKNYEDFRKRITESEKNLLEALRLLL